MPGHQRVVPGDLAFGGNADLQLSALVCPPSLISHQAPNVQPGISVQLTPIHTYFGPHPAHLPWARRWQVPTHKTITAWRRRLGEGPLEQLFWRGAGPLVAARAPRSVQVPR